jgi:hypothetical protein
VEWMGNFFFFFFLVAWVVVAILNGGKVKRHRLPKSGPVISDYQCFMVLDMRAASQVYISFRMNMACLKITWDFTVIESRSYQLSPALTYVSRVSRKVVAAFTASSKNSTTTRFGSHDAQLLQVVNPDPARLWCFHSSPSPGWGCGMVAPGGVKREMPMIYP